ncbi:MAG TPA: GNAT family N-acetyltransferase [Solirubrobacterales bacterium]|nr:GNAT family N-acetyltransferase [Solirubrobacterales bacterium]
MAAAVSHKPSRRELRDGSIIELREIRSDDKAALAAGFDRLSPESRYRRFFTPLERLTETDLAYLTEVDHHDHEAVIGFDLDGQPVGVARYVRGYEQEIAEVAVVVVDDWQGKGAATALLERLAERAAENGVERFVALILQENAEAIELFRSVAETTGPRRTPDGYLELEIEVPSGPVPGTPLGRALRTAAAGRVAFHPWRLIRARLQALQEGRSGK